MAVYDASWQRPSPSLLKPGDGLILYCSRTLSKTPSADQCDAYRARDVQVGFVFEDSADRAAVQGFAAGVSDGALALTQARSKGHPKGWTVYFACDVVSPLNLEYARGFRDGLTAYYEPGLYAGDRNLERARVGLGYTQLWQASASSWSDHWGPNHHGTYQYAALWQSAGSSPVPGTDLNVVNRAGWNHPLIGTPQDTVTTPEGDDMPFTDWPQADQDALADAVWKRGVTNPASGLVQAAGVRLVGAQAQDDLDKAVAAVLAQAKANGTGISGLATGLAGAVADLQTALAAVQAAIDALEPGTGGSSGPLTVSLTGTATPA
jgi:hypothetical protein